MTAKELKEALANVPDDAEVKVDNNGLNFVPTYTAEYYSYSNAFVIYEEL